MSWIGSSIFALFACVVLMFDTQGRRWAGIAAVDALTEIVIMAVPVAIIWPLKMSVELKVQASAAFLFRIG